MASQSLPLMASHAARRTQAWIGGLSLLIISLIGLVAFLSPFWAPALNQGDVSNARLQDSPLIMTILSIACLIVVFANLGPSLSSKSVALLGVLIGINVVLRAFSLSFLPSGHFSPIFLLITLVGYVFGAQMGFLMGALTMLCSAFVTGGIGPWLPFQMLAAGWMGMTAAWLRTDPARQITTRREVLKLAIFSLVWGLLYGLIMNLYFWPFLAGEAAMTWTPGSTLTDGIAHYAVFYAVQSAGPDLVRGAGNLALVLAAGLPLLRVFRRFRTRFEVSVIER
jgi:energy-coupling factor transport system substrate-specific component